MRPLTLATTLLLGGIWGPGLLAPVLAQAPPEELALSPGEIEAAQVVDQVTPDRDPLLRSVEEADRLFTRLENTHLRRVSYFHQRRLGEAVVEGDYIRYQFDTETSELVEETRRWRRDLPDALCPVIPPEQAEALAEGVVERSRLVVVAPDSYIFRVDPTPANPCWVVTSRDGERLVLTVVDAITGEVLGNGVPPPYQGLSIHGPDHDPNCDNNHPLWYPWAQNAHDWFETMGYDTVRIPSATQEEIEGHIQSDETVMLYELDHGGSASFKIRCEDDLSSTEVATMIEDYASMPFTFMGSCEGMCLTGDGYFEHEFRKGGAVDTVVVGYCGMSWDQCDDCWGHSIPWQDVLFDHMSQGSSVGNAFLQANLAFPDCSDDGHACMRIAGDTSLTFAGPSPLVTRSYCGSFSGSLMPVTSRAATRAHHIRCDSVVPTGATLLVEANSTERSNEVAFVNDSTLTVDGSLTIAADVGQEITIVSSLVRDKGMRVRETGQVVAGHGGQLRVHD